jgi:tight adherence protein B
MAPLVGMLGGAGLLLIWWSAWETPESGRRRPRTSRLEDLLRSAGIEKVSAAGLLASCIGLGAFTTLAFFAVTGSWPISGCFGLFGGWLPMAMVRWRARKRTAVLRQLWPDVVDHLRSAIRAGLSLPEALIQLGDKGPVELRHVFVGGSDLGRLLGTLAEFLRESARTRSELEARQSWTVNAARLAVAAPWIVLVLLASRPEAVMAYNTPLGAAVLLGGLAVSLLSYAIMLRIGALPEEQRVLR